MNISFKAQTYVIQENVEMNEIYIYVYVCVCVW